MENHDFGTRHNSSVEVVLAAMPTDAKVNLRYLSGDESSQFYLKFNVCLSRSNYI
jgi:hypothetical protein